MAGRNKSLQDTRYYKEPSAWRTTQIFERMRLTDSSTILSKLYTTNTPMNLAYTKDNLNFLNFLLFTFSFLNHHSMGSTYSTGNKLDLYDLLIQSSLMTACLLQCREIKSWPADCSCLEHNF